MKIVMVIGLGLAAATASAEQPWITDADYPPQLAQERKEGLTEVEVVFGPDGRPSRCSVVKFSGTGVLDATVCRVLFRRARVQPGEPRVQIVRHKWTAPALR